MGQNWRVAQVRGTGEPEEQSEVSYTGTRCINSGPEMR